MYSFMTESVSVEQIERGLAVPPARDRSAICGWLRADGGRRGQRQLSRQADAGAASLLNNPLLRFWCVKCIIFHLLITVWSNLLWKRDMSASKWTRVKNYCLTMLVDFGLSKWNGFSLGSFVTVTMANVAYSLLSSESLEANYVRRIAVSSLGEKIWRFFFTPAKKTKIRKKFPVWLG